MASTAVSQNKCFTQSYSGHIYPSPHNSKTQSLFMRLFQAPWLGQQEHSEHYSLDLID